MKLGVFTPIFNGCSLKEALDFLSGEGVHAIELGAGGYPGKAHADPEELLKSPEKLSELVRLLAAYKTEVPAVSAHGNPLHPDKKIAEGFRRDFKNAILLAE